MNSFLKRSLSVTSTLALTAGITAVGSASAMAAVTSSYSFKINSMSTTGVIGIDANPTSGDDGGFLAVTSGVLLRDGDTDTFSYNRTTLADVAATDADLGDDEIFTDLATETAYVMQDDYASLTALDADGNLTETDVSLSEEIPLRNDDDWVAANGAGQLAFWNATIGDLYLVSLPSGLVNIVETSTAADFTGVSPDLSNGENDFSISYSGVLEYDCTNYSIVMMDTDANFSRFGLSSATQETLADTGVGYLDNDTLIVSTTANRWYQNNEDDGENTVLGVNVSAFEEPILSGAATMTLTPNVCSDPLADTGVSNAQTVSLAALAGVMALAGVAIVARRRSVKA